MIKEMAVREFWRKSTIAKVFKCQAFLSLIERHGAHDGRQKPDNECSKENGTASWSKDQRTKPVAWTLSEEWLW